MTRSSRFFLAAALVLCGCSSQGRSAAMVEAEGAEPPPEAMGMVRFALDDFGGLSGATLETNALPYRLVAAALVLEEEARTGERMERGDLPRIFRRFGFLDAERIANWRGGARPRSNRPLGMVTGMVEGPTPFVRIEAATLGCASCHGGTTYDAAGRPTGEAWLGLPNTSLDLDAYVWAVYRALGRAAQDPDALARRASELFPEMGGRERFTLRRILLPRVRSRMAELERTVGAPTPFPNGGPGRTNGVAALKRQLGLLAADRTHPGETGFTSIPELGSRQLRGSLLYDGTFAPRGVNPRAHRGAADADSAHLDSLAAIVTFFTVPSMGMHPDEAVRAVPRVREVMGWLARDYAPPPFPGAIDAERSRAGRVLYEARCAQCHGSYAEGPPPRRLVSYPNLLVPQDSIGTDPARWQAMDSALLARLRTTAYARHVDARRTGGYVAPILSGLWATAPYLHNGSVPTLWHLMTPATRPARFQVGGHALDFARMGIAGEPDAEGTYRYPAGYVPWSTPEVYDTREPGLGNGGHEREFAGLPDAEKRALIEYLKGL
jgi:mono/diheme cytochrome c family protein